MKQLFAIALALTLVAAGVAEAREYHGYRHYLPADRVTESGLVSHRHYKNVSGHTVHSPSATYSGRAPAGASAQCRDGSFSFSEHHRGTCSYHGGVASWL